MNTALPEALETLSTDPYGAGWIAKIRVTDDAALSTLLDFTTYQKQCQE